MTGAEAVPVASTSAPVAVPGDEGWLADGEQKKKGDKRNTAKENAPDESKDARSPEAEETVEDGDDAAWLRRRQAATNGASGEEADDRPSVCLTSMT